MEDIQIQRLEVVTIKPGDTILVHFKRHMPDAFFERIRDSIKKTFPNCGPIVFIDDDIDVEFAREG